MRWQRIKVRNMGPIGEIEVRFDELDGRLSAVTGPNGSGKSTLLELMLGALYRTTPTRGSLMELASARDSQVEVDVEHAGHRYTVRQLCDNISRKQESLILDGEGHPLIASTKVSAVDEVIARHLPPRDLVLISMFAAQKSSGFISAGRADRKQLLLRLLGLEQIEQRAAAARAEGAAASVAFDKAQAKVAEIVQRVGDPVSCEALLRTSEQNLETQRRRALQLAEKLESIRVEGARVTAHNRDADAALVAWRAAEGRRAAAELKLSEVSTRIKNNREMQGRADEIRLAIARSSELRGTAEGQKLRLQALETDLEKLRTDKEWLDDSIAQRTTRIAALDVQLARLGEARDAAAGLPGAEQAAATIYAQSAVADGLQSDLDAAVADSSGTRIGRLRDGLGLVISAAIDLDAAQGYARISLEHDDALGLSGSALQQRRVEAGKQAKATARSYETAKATEARLRQLASSVPDLERVEAERVEQAEQLQAEQAERVQVLTRIAGVAAEMRGLSPAYAATTVEIEAVDKVAKLSIPLERSEARLAELEPQARDAATEVSERLVERDAITLIDKLPPPDGGARFIAEATEVQRSISAIEREVGRLQGQLDIATAGQGDLAEARAAVEPLALSLTDWRRLEADLGRNGLQATVIDAALPELTTIANDLLHTAFGPRYTIELRSQAASSDGKKTVEVLDVIVIDSDKGLELPIERYSGGQQAILIEGLSLALTTLAARSTGIVRPTIVRDEAGAALDDANNRAWIAMLRQATELIGADRVVFVSHNEAVKALADSRIEL